MEVKYFVSLNYENVSIENKGTEASVVIPIEKLFLLALDTLRNGTAHNSVSSDILSDIHDYL